MSRNRWYQLLTLLATFAILLYQWRECHRYGIPDEVFRHPTHLEGTFDMVRSGRGYHSRIGGVRVVRSAWFGGGTGFARTDLPVGATLSADVVEVATERGPVNVAMDVRSPLRVYVQQTPADVVALWNQGGSGTFVQWGLFTLAFGLTMAWALRQDDSAA